MILRDLEFVETRLGRDPQPTERTALEKMRSLLEQEQFLFRAGLTPPDWEAVAAHSFTTSKPVVVSLEGEEWDALLLRAFQESGYISFLTVGGKENRAWPIRRGTTAWEAAGAAAGAREADWGGARLTPHAYATRSLALSGGEC